MEIHWHSPAPNALQRIHLEYEVQLQVRMVLIREAEHLMDYLSLIAVDISEGEGLLSIGSGTPEPLYSILRRNLAHIDPFPVGEPLWDNPSFGSLFHRSDSLSRAMEPA